MKKKIGEEIQTVCKNMVAEILSDENKIIEIGNYICKVYKCNPPCHRSVCDPVFVDLEDCKHRK